MAEPVEPCDRKDCSTARGQLRNYQRVNQRIIEALSKCQERSQRLFRIIARQDKLLRRKDYD